MMITLTPDDITKLQPSTLADLTSVLFPSTAAPVSVSNNPEGFDWDGVVNLSSEQIADFLQGCSPKTVGGLKVFAEYGPVITANLLQEAGIHNYGHFQGRVTQRTRTITGEKHAFLFTWDDWNNDENAERGYGQYAVTETTYRSLRSYFNLA